MAASAHQPRRPRRFSPSPITAEVRRVLGLLDAFYELVDQRSAQLQAACRFPCQAGCEACCHDPVFLSRLEWLGMVELIERRRDWALLDRALARAEALYAQHGPLLESFCDKPQSEDDPRWARLNEIGYVCPFLEEGRCAVYERREMVGRVYGMAYLRPRYFYGCQTALAHFRALLEQPLLHDVLELRWRLRVLPWTERQQVAAYYLVHQYGRLSSTPGAARAGVAAPSPPPERAGRRP